MSGLNLHNIVRKAVTAINPDEDIILRQSIGEDNVAGTVTPIYSEPLDARAQFQTFSAGELYHRNMVDEAEIVRKVYLYADTALPPFSMNRSIGRSGDYILRKSDGSVWLIIGVNDDFSNVGWVCVTAKLQVDSPIFGDVHE